MSTVILGRAARAAQHTDDYGITVERAQGLAELIGRPQTHIHRFVEKLSFRSRGGQLWQRDLQIHIPDSPSRHEAWWVVPLGPFRRRRFADIAVVSAAGSRLNFVTRDQHGTALTKALLNKHFTGLELDGIDALLDEAPMRTEYADLRQNLYTFYTKIGDGVDGATEAERLTYSYRTLLVQLGFNPTPDMGNGLEKRLKAFAADLAKAVDTTQYLCWVKARPGDVVNLHVSHTTRDPQHKLEDGTLWGLAKALGAGIFGFLWGSTRRRDTWNRWYVHYGLAPIPYAFNTPTHEYTTSYYSTIDPPANTVVAYLDWEQRNSWDNQDEVDCSLDNVHIFREDDDALGDSDETDGAASKPLTTRAYLRCTPHQHKLILGTAVMSLVLVILVAVGRFPSNLDNALQAIVTGAPSVLIAYLAHQQRHYYAHTLRRVRGVLWIYLSIEVLFLVAVAFSHPVDEAGTPGLSWKATIAAFLLGASSVCLFIWQFALGHNFERAVRFLANRRKQRLELKEECEQKAREGEESDEDEPCIRKPTTVLQLVWWWLKASRWDKEAIAVTNNWQCYELAVEQFSRLTRRVMVIAVLVTLALLATFWHPVEQDKASHEAHPHVVFIESNRSQ